MRGIGSFHGTEDRARYRSSYDTAMGVGPAPNKEIDVETAFGPTRVYRFGDGAGRPVVLVPGMAMTAASWLPLVGPLARRYPVYAVDTIGEPGMSEQTAPLADHVDRTRWLDEVMDRLGLTGVHLVGASSGGCYAAWQAIHAPDRLASVTLLDPTTVTARFANRVLWYALVTMVLNRDSTWRRFLCWSAGADVTDRPDVALSLAGARHYRAKLPPQVRPRPAAIAGIRVPLLALFAGRSAVHDARRAAGRLAALLPAAEVELWPEPGHLMWLADRDRDRIVARVLDFLARH